MPHQNTFKALADPTRRQILMHLSTGDKTIAQVCGNFEMTRAAVKKHLTVLQQGELISVQKIGRQAINHLEPMALKSVATWLEYFNQFWDDKLSDLKTAVAAHEKQNPKGQLKGKSK